jgi:hypothetical protein
LHAQVAAITCPDRHFVPGGWPIDKREASIGSVFALG